MKFRKIVLLSLLFLTLFPGQAMAVKHHKDKVAPPADLLIQPQLPKDNIGGKHSGYFNLKKSNKEREINISVYNTTDYPLAIQVNPENANTAMDGGINYYGTRPTDPKLLKDPGTNYLMVKSQDTIAPKQKVVVNVKVKPTDKIIGTKATAINIIGVPMHQKGSILNKYVYAVGVILNGNKLSNKHLKKMYMYKPALRGIKGDKGKIIMNIANPDATYLMNNRTEMKLYSANWLFFSQYNKTRNEMKIAPSSRFDYSIPLDGKKLNTGAYKVVMHNVNDHYEQTQTRYIEILSGRVRFISKAEYLWIKVRTIVLWVMAIGVIAYIVNKIRKKRRQIE